MWYEMADKKQWKRYVGYALFLFLSYSIGNAAAVVSTMTLQPEKVEKEMKTVAITFLMILSNSLERWDISKTLMPLPW